MKKFLSFVLSFCLIIPCVLALSACSAGFEYGSTYTVSGASVVWADENEKNTILGFDTEEEFLERNTGTGSIVFNEDGTMVSTDSNGETQTYYFTKDGNMLYVYSDETLKDSIVEFRISGSKLIQTIMIDEEYESYIEMTYSK